MRFKNITRFSLALLFVSQTFVQAQTDNSLIAHYPMDGNANDISGKAHHGTGFSIDTADGHDGRPNSALFFNGVTSYIEIPDHQDFQFQNFTISYWINLYSDKGTVIFGKSEFETANNEAFSMAYNYYKVSRSSVQTGFHFGYKVPGYCTSPGNGWVADYSQKSVDLNTWNHVTASFDGAFMRTYINGMMVSETASKAAMASCVGGSLKIGKWWKHFETPLYGLLDEFRIYNRALSSSEILHQAKETVTNVDSEISTSINLLSVTPNPVLSGTVAISVNKNCSAAIYNEMGVVVKELVLISGQNMYDVSDLHKGVYLLRSENQTVRFVK